MRRVLGDGDDDQRDQREAERHAQPDRAGLHERGDRRQLRRAGDQRQREHDDDHRRLGERGDHHFAARPDAAEAGADIEPGQSQEKTRAAKQAGDHDQIGRPAEGQAQPEGRHQRCGNPGRRENQIGRDAEQPRRVVGQHDLLAQQSEKVAIGLHHRRALPAQ